MVADALESALAALDLRPEDAAAADLARRYVKALEDGADPARVGPPLLAALESLGMTPRARAAVAAKGGTGDASPARAALDELRQRRRTRLDRAADRDTATP